MILRNLQLFSRTALHLKPRQLMSRAAIMLRSGSIDHDISEIQKTGKFTLHGGPDRIQSMVAEDEFLFLNVFKSLSSGTDWNECTGEELWIYNLHYFDDVNTTAAEQRTDWHRALLDRWIRENPPFGGIGWDPYPTSLRIVNWIKWASRGNEMKPAWLESLALQSCWLRRRLEYHLLANHLFANAKALVFAGAFFEGDEAEEWLSKGLSILKKEIPEQVLGDGGHFERSPMYHSTILEDLLDLVNLLEGNPLENPKTERIAGIARSHSQDMLSWLRGMCHPDGEISFFNDAAFGIAPTLEQLGEYGGRLGIAVPGSPPNGITHFADAGYVRYQSREAVALMDVALVGPDYQPGHAHADTLSFELSLFGQRVFVNSGTSTYEADEERHRQRSTLAHNTVEVNGENSSEVWKSFRVARRAYPRDMKIAEEGERTTVICSHDGYKRLKGKIVHRREWQFYEGGMVVFDDVVAEKMNRIAAFAAPTCVASFHLHPDVSVEHIGGGKLEFCLNREQIVKFSAIGGEVALKDSTWHPEFGLSIPNKVIRCRFAGERLECRLDWSSA